jgi:hypothetical protein
MNPDSLTSIGTNNQGKVTGNAVMSAHQRSLLHWFDAGGCVAVEKSIGFHHHAG